MNYDSALLQQPKRTWATDTDKHHVASRITNDPGYLDEMDDRVREEDQVHVRTSNDVIVLVQEVLEPLLQSFERLDRFVNFWQFHIRVFNLAIIMTQC